MTFFMKSVLVALPMCLILSGCSGRNRTVTTYKTATPTSTRNAIVADRGFVTNDAVLPYPLVAEPAVGPRYNVTLEEIRDHVMNGSAVIVDARSTGSYAVGHVRGALNIPAGQAASQVRNFSQTFSHDQLIIIYCVNPSCAASDMVYESLEAEGFSNMLVYSPGWQRLSTERELQ